MSWIGNFLSGGEEREETLSDRSRIEIDRIAKDIEENLNRIYDGRNLRGFQAETEYDDGAEITVRQNGYDTPFCRVGLTTRNGPIEAEYIETDRRPYNSEYPSVDDAIAGVHDTLMVDPTVQQRSPEDLPDTKVPKQG